MRGDPEDPLERRLRALVRVWPGLREAAEVYRVTLPLLRDAGPLAGPIALTEDRARWKLARGETLLGGETLVFDRIAARELMLRLARGLSEAGIAVMSPIGAALEEDRLNPAELLGHVAEGDYPFVAARAGDEALSPPLLWMLAQSALKPAFRAWCRELTPLVRPENDWENARCYLCGAAAALGELRGNGQARYLRCGQCGADWLHRRIRCIYCSNENPSRLGVFYPEGRWENVRVEVCENCRGYLKVVASFSPASPEELAVLDLSTLYLDRFAQEQGYLRPA